MYFTFSCIFLSQNLEAEEDSDDEKDEVGGLFKVAKKNLRESREKKILQNARDCSIFRVGNVDDWESDMNEVFSDQNSCFIMIKLYYRYYG